MWPPLLFLNGLLGSKLFVAVDDSKLYPTGLKCVANASVHQAWMPFSVFATGSTNKKLCTLSDITPLFDGTNFTTDPATIVQTFDDYFGSVYSAECLLALKSGKLCKWHGDAQYMYSMFQTMLLSWNYVANKTLYAATFDWRFAPNNEILLPFYQNLTSLIEMSHHITGEKVVIFAHSYGGIVLNHFLHNNVKKDFRTSHIRSIITVGTPYGGAVSALLNVISGVPFEMTLFEFISAAAVRNMSQFTESIGFNLPLSPPFGQEFVVATVNNTQFSISNMVTFMAQMSAFLPIVAYENAVSSATKRCPPEDVTTHIVYGSDVPTPEQLIYTAGKKVQINEGDGDGTVNKISLSHCDKASQNIHVKVFPNAGHTNILRDRRLKDFIFKLLEPTHQGGAGPTLQTVHLQTNYADCFSIFPLLQCDESGPLESFEMLTPFACYGPILTAFYSENFERRVFHLPEYDVTFFMEVSVHKNCIRQ